MYRTHSCRLELLLGLVAATGLGACGGADPAVPAAPASSPLAAARCTAGEMRSCPCLGEGSGLQLCDTSGSSFGACTGCPSAIPGPGGAGSTAVPALNAGSMAPPSAAGRGGAGGTAGQALPRAGAGGASGASGAGGRPAAGGSGGNGSGASSAGSSARPDALSAERGVTCGVGLPTQCEPEAEKCCKRSLLTDSCVPKSQACECDADNCTVITVACDGPEDCATGQVCCAAGTGRSFSEFTCAAQCSSASRQACHVKSDCSSALTCAISQQLASISVCTDPQSLRQ